MELPITCFLKLLKASLIYSFSIYSISDLYKILQISKSVQDFVLKQSNHFIIHLVSFILKKQKKHARFWLKKFFLPRFQDRISPEFLEKVNKVLKITRNLVKNPNGNKNFDFWKITENGGHEWKFENNWYLLIDIPKHIKFDKQQGAFCGSYGTCTMIQKIDLEGPLKEGQTFSQKLHLNMGVYVSRRWDCRCEATIKVRIIDYEQKTIEEFSKFVKDELQPTYKTFQYNYMQINFNFAILPDRFKQIKYAEIELSTIDCQFWAGWYAARFTGAYCRVFPASLVNS